MFRPVVPIRRAVVAAVASFAGLAFAAGPVVAADPPTGTPTATSVTATPTPSGTASARATTSTPTPTPSVSSMPTSAPSAPAARPTAAASAGVRSAVVAPNDVTTGSITGKVTVPSGHTTAGLTVSASISSGTASSDLGTYGSAQVAADGSYTISALSPGSYNVGLYSWSVSTDLLLGGYPKNPVSVTAARTTSGIDFAPVVGGKITGKVTVPAGYTTVGLTVSAWGVGYGWAQVAADGSYTISTLPTGSFSVSLSASSGLSNLVLGNYPKNPVSVTAGRTTSGIDFAPVVGGTITGKVTVPAGHPTTGLTVRVSGPSMYRSVQVGADGSYTVSALATGSYYLSLSSSGGSTDLILGNYPKNPVSVTAGRTTSGIDFAPVVGATITGKVTVPAGYSAAGLQVTAGGSAGYGSAMTTADGSYAISGLLAGDYVVQVYASSSDLVGGYYPGRSTWDTRTTLTVAAGATVSGINLSMVVGGSITGKVTVPSGHSPLGLTVSAAGRSAAVAADGSYRISGLDTGSYVVSIAGSGSGSSDLVLGCYPGAGTYAQATAVPVTVGRSTSGIDFALVVGATVRGTVTVPAGSSASGLHVAVTSVSDGYLSGTTTVAADGSYAIIGLRAGSYVVELSTYGTSGLVLGYYPGQVSRLHAQPVTVALGATRSGVDFAPVASTGAISGTVTAPSGVDVTGLTVTAESVVSGTFSSVGVGAGGTWSVRGLAAGRYRVRLSGAGTVDGYYPGLVGWNTAGLVLVSAGAASTGIGLRAVAPGTVSGTVTAAGKPVVGTSVEVVSTADSSMFWATTDSTGAYQATDVPPGSYVVWATAGATSGLYSGYAPRGSARAGATVLAVAAGGRATADVALQPSGTISGRVTDASGAPLAGVRVHATGKDLNAGDATTGADGRYVISSGLGAGDYRISFVPSSGASAPEYYADAAGSSTATTVTLTAGGTRTGVDATLERSGNLTVRALDPTSGKDVTAAADPELLTSVDGWDAPGDPNVGAGTFAGLRPGSVKVGFARSSADTPYVAQYFTAPSGTTTSYASASPVTITAGRTTTITATLATGAQITGKVTNADGAPAVGAQVDAFVDDGSLATRYATTGLDGTYTIRGLLPGSYQVAVPSSSVTGDDTFYGTGVKPASPNVVVSGKATTRGIDITVETPFTDVQPSAAFAADIAWLAAQRIALPSADGRFGSAVVVTRSALAAFLYRAAGSPAYTPPPTSPFADVRTTDAGYQEMCWSLSKGIARPGADKRFGPGDAMSRRETAAYLYRLAGSPTYTPPATSPFADVATGDLYYKEISWLVSRGIATVGADRAFGPTGTVGRGVLASLLHRASSAGVFTPKG